MKYLNTLIILAFLSALAMSAQLGGLSRTNSVTTPAELAEYAVDPASLQAQIDVITAILDGGITTNLSSLVISNGVVVGTF